MDSENCSSELVILGFSNFHAFKIPIFCLILVIYIITCFENFMIIFLIFTSARLHTPMYLLLSNLSLCDLLHITTFVPKMLNDMISEKKSISVIGCIAQLSAFAIVGDTFTLTYALMAYDRYLAISNPLRYSSLINNRLIVYLISGLWLFSFSCVMITTILINQLEFCGPSVIDHVYCDLGPFLALSLSDTTFIKTVISFVGTLLTFLPFMMICLSYVFILHAILKIQSTIGRKKTFSTCSSHLIMVAIYYGVYISIYVIPHQVNTTNLNKSLSFVYITITPFLNPIIYTLKNQEIHRAYEAKIRKFKDFYC